MKPRVFVVGALNIDLVVAADRLPGPGETVVGPEVERHGGGKGANAAIAAARSGGQVRYCGAVGADESGRSALAELQAESVEVTDVAVLESVSTGTALIVVDPGGENQIAVGAGANAAVSGDAVRRAVERASDWARCVLVSTEISPEGVTAAVRSASAHGLRCVLNPAPVTAELVDLLHLGPVLTPNASELADLYARLEGDAEASVTMMARHIAARTAAPVIVTMGGEGVLVCDSDGATTTLPAPDAVVRDTTGAGDTFNGVFAAALADGKSVLAASERGVIAASMSVSQAGARAGMPSADEIDAALRATAG
jgi:ribokinase